METNVLLENDDCIDFERHTMEEILIIVLIFVMMMSPLLLIVGPSFSFTPIQIKLIISIINPLQMVLLICTLMIIFKIIKVIYYKERNYSPYDSPFVIMCKIIITVTLISLFFNGASSLLINSDISGKKYTLYWIIMIKMIVQPLIIFTIFCPKDNLSNLIINENRRKISVITHYIAIVCYIIIMTAMNTWTETILQQFHTYPDFGNWVYQLLIAAFILILIFIVLECSQKFRKDVLCKICQLTIFYLLILISILQNLRINGDLNSSKNIVN